MPASTEQPLTTLLEAVRAGDTDAFDRVFSQAYEELHRMAHVVRGGRMATLDTTGLVHETYVKLAGAEVLAPENRLHFMRIAARAMRQVLINAAEKRVAAKRGGGELDVTFEEHLHPSSIDAAELLALHDALDRLEALDTRQAQIVECRYFAGMTIQETASLVGVSVPTVNREWRMARAWLAAALAERDSP